MSFLPDFEIYTYRKELTFDDFYNGISYYMITEFAAYS